MKQLPLALCLATAYGLTEAGELVPYPTTGTSHVATVTATDARLDEAMAGRTLLGTPVSKRTALCFPAESEDVFWQMDKVATGKDKKLEPLNFDADGDGKISDKERDAIRGRNTWLLWGGGNETFWGWLQERGYGLTDFLILMDSRQRTNRFRRAGLINQPGFRMNNKNRILGLYFDEPTGEEAKLKLRPGEPNGIGASRSRTRAFTQEESLRVDKSCLNCHGAQKDENKRLFEPGDDSYEKVKAQLGGKLAYDGLDPEIYGYTSGIFGLRLFLNPDFFGNTRAAARARAYWDERVVRDTNGGYYTNASIHSDPKLVRPFRVSMSCGFCHVGPHPLNPPKDPEQPAWENLSSIIGDQFWDPQPAFANLLRTNNFLYHFLASQPPGTIDTSLVSTDHINNPNTINAVFDLPARLIRAMHNSVELQSPENLLMGSVEDPQGVIYRHFPRVLLDGADSCGALVALLRVPVNIGTYSEEWSQCHNPIIGFRPQKPFRVQACQTDSVYWQSNERFRIPYLAAFFTFTNSGGQSSTAPMKLANAQNTDANKIDSELAGQGREVFLGHCAICHSSKQPDNLKIEFKREMPGGWESANRDPASGALILPMDFANWEAFKKSPAYKEYVKEITTTAGPAGPDDPFIKNNFLSSEVRIPITLVGSNSGRSAATNAKRGQVWDNFSSEGYKSLPSVGAVRYYNPYSLQLPDNYGNNDSYILEGGGPGYYRPASLISLWATAPYLHNNTLGVYKPKLDADDNPTSVKARLAAFQDGITKLLWNAKRNQPGEYPSAQPSPGELRKQLASQASSPAASRDPGFIYRIPQDTQILMAAPFIRPLIEGVLGRWPTRFFTVLLPIAFALLFIIAAWNAQARHAGIAFLFLAAGLATFITVTGLGTIGGPLSVNLIICLWWLAVLALTAAGFVFFFVLYKSRGAVRGVFVAFAILSLVLGIAAHLFLDGSLGPLSVGPIPRGTPVNLLMNSDPTKKRELAKAGLAIVRALVEIRRNKLTEDAAFRVFDREAGPALHRASKCPDFVLDRGHWFGEYLTDQEKGQLIEFLKTL